jgi:hypothetical protein
VSVAYGKGSKGRATKLHSIIVRSLGHCEACDYKCACADKWKHGVCKLQCAHQKMDWDEEVVRLKAMMADIKEGRLTLAEAREIEHAEN